MFNNLTQRFSNVFQRLAGINKITETNIQETLQEIRTALLEADVAIKVVDTILDQVKTQALGEKVLKSLTPGQALTKIVNDVLTQLMGEANERLDLTTQPPAVILIAGLQGSGKTTTVAKLARWLKTSQKKQVMVVSCDIYRPAAIEQLQRLAEQVGVSYYPSHASDNPLQIAKEALKAAKQQHQDVLLIDTAGRLHVDPTMMAEIQALHQAVTPIETLFVVDSMTGQDAANTARAFHAALPLTGIILSKTDGDARGGAALSIRHITGKPIKFLGTGEKVDALEPFYPDRMASRILGMGDIVSLVEQVQEKTDHEKAKKIAKKLQKGHKFDLQDFLEQLQQMRNMGSFTSLLEKIPGAAKLAQAGAQKMPEEMTKKFEALICSMTPQERRYPALIKGSRKQRIALGSGQNIVDVNQLLKQFTKTQTMMQKLMSPKGMEKMLQRMQHILPSGGDKGGFPF